MPLVKLDTGYNIEVEFVVAPFSQRLLAWTIDVFICWMLTKALAALLGTYSFFCMDLYLEPQRLNSEPSRVVLSSYL